MNCKISEGMMKTLPFFLCGFIPIWIAAVCNLSKPEALVTTVWDLFTFLFKERNCFFHS
jgi:hypothetical protein